MFGEPSVVRASSGDCIVKRVNWVSINSAKTPIHAGVQIRYRSKPVGVTIIPLDDGVRLVFDEPQFGITPGQAAVWYSDDVLLGGGIIEK